jgi:Protein of unknown function (DUF3053)
VTSSTSSFSFGPGAIVATTLVFEASTSTWIPASESAPFKLAVAPVVAPVTAISPPVAESTVAASVELTAAAAQTARRWQKPALTVLLYVLGFFLPLNLVWDLSGGAEIAGRVAGRALGYALIAWLISRLAISRADIERRKTASLAIAGIFVAFTFISMALVRESYAERAKLQAAVNRALSASGDNVQDPSATGSQVAPDTPRESLTTGVQLSSLVIGGTSSERLASDMAVAMDWLASTSRRSDQLSGDLRAEVEGVPLNSVLEPANLITVSGLEAGRAHVTEYANYVVRFGATWRRELDRMLAEGEQLPVSQDFKVGFLRGMKRSVDNTREQVNDYIAVETRFVALLNRLLDFMAARVGRTKINEGQLVFETDQEVSAYNAMMAELQEISREESDAIDRMNSSRQQGRGRLEALARELNQQ